MLTAQAELYVQPPCPTAKTKYRTICVGFQVPRKLELFCSFWGGSPSALSLLLTCRHTLLTSGVGSPPIQYLNFNRGWAARILTSVGLRAASSAFIRAGPGYGGLGTVPTLLTGLYTVATLRQVCSLSLQELFSLTNITPVLLGLVHEQLRVALQPSHGGYPL